uniref:K Homology domain-containing protein n=2 Tax=Acrobeloides nanus TaxID=290746 RepID=A0A914E657_9BILA
IHHPTLSSHSISPAYHQDSTLNGSHSSNSSVHNGSFNGNHYGANPTPPNKPAYTVEYLTQLLKDKKQLAAFPNVFHHLERLADDEINRVRVALFQFEFAKEPLHLPDSIGEVTSRQEKVFVPVKDFPEYNFVGRILGPRGMTAKQLEQETGCKIMVRGKGSMRDKNKEDMNRGKPNWEHLNEELHVLIQCEDTPNRIEVKMRRAIEEVNKLLVPAPEGEDELKKKQLMELAIINGTFSNRNQNQTQAAQMAAAAALVNGVKNPMLQLANSSAGLLGATNLASLPAALRTPNLAGAPLIMQQPKVGAAAAAANQANSQAAAAQAMALQQLNALAGANFMATPTSMASMGAAGLMPQAAEYQQLLLNSMHYDPNTLAQIQAAQQLQQHQIAAMLQAQAQAGQSAVAQFGDYSQADVSAGQFIRY